MRIKFLLQNFLKFSCTFLRACKMWFFLQAPQERIDINRNDVRTDNWDTQNVGLHFLQTGRVSCQ